MLFTENSLIHVRKFCILKPPLGHDSAIEDISATFSMLVSMQGFFPCLSSMICSLVIEGVAPEWFCIEIGMQQNFACPVSIIWGSPTPREAREWVVLDLIALRKHDTRRLILTCEKKIVSLTYLLWLCHWMNRQSQYFFSMQFYHHRLVGFPTKPKNIVGLKFPSPGRLPWKIKWFCTPKNRK